MSIVWRVRAFIVLLIAYALFVPDPWAIVAGAVTYVVVVMPSIITDWRRH